MAIAIAYLILPHFSSIDLKLLLLLISSDSTLIFKSSKELTTKTLHQITKKDNKIKIIREIINDFISRRFPDWAKQKVLDIYIPENAVSSVKDNLEKLAVQNSYSGHIRLHKDSNLSSAECKIIWGNEEEVFSTEQILDKIREQLSGVLENE